jgi:redox-sensitive bicupin YhaK (pirin superfamily)
MASIENNTSIEYKMNKNGNGAYIMVIEGEVEIDGKKLSRRDAVGISETESVVIKGVGESKQDDIIIIEVPMN